MLNDLQKGRRADSTQICPPQPHQLPHTLPPLTDMRPGDHQPVIQFQLARQSLLMPSLCQLTLGQRAFLSCITAAWFSHIPFYSYIQGICCPQGSLSLEWKSKDPCLSLRSLSLEWKSSTPRYPKSVFTSCPTEVGQIKPEYSYTDLHVISSQTSDLRIPNIFLSRSISFFFSITISISFIVISM